MRRKGPKRPERGTREDTRDDHGLVSLDFHVLGPLAVSSDGRDVTPVRPKQRALLALLLLRVGEVVPSDELIEALWAGRPPRTAQTALHGHVGALRRLLGPEAIETRTPGYRLCASPEQTDLGRFRARLDDARKAALPAHRVGHLKAALGSFRGEPLVDFRNEPFAREDAALLEEMRFSALEEYAEVELELGHDRELVPELERLVAASPMRERVRELLMLALYRSHRQAEALEVYRSGRRVLMDELGLEPGAQLRDLERAILAHDPALAAPARPGSSLPTGSPGRLGNLPELSTSFVGRVRELGEVRRVLSGERLVTIHGAGGGGKTRLALRAAEGAADGFPQGAWLVELAPVSDPALVWHTIAAVLDIPEEPGRGLAESVLAALAGLQLLLVLDNCEHLHEAATEVTVALLAACRGVKVLATSREPLGISGEVVWPIPELSSPDQEESELDSLLRHDAVQLFAERGARAQPGYRVDERDATAVAQICRRLDGMPLAIELAAARLSMLSAVQIEERLADRFRLLTLGEPSAPARHHTLRAVAEWSYDLLSAAERAALARVSVFAGGFDIDAAERVLTSDSTPEERVLDLLGGLVAKSLVTRRDEHGRARYGLHETIREFAAERLLEAGDTAQVCGRHLDAYLALVARVDDELRGPNQFEWAQRLSLEQDNFRGALAWGLSHGEPEKSLDLAWHLHHFWSLRGNLDESARWLGATLTRTTDAPPSVERTRALSRWGELAERAGDFRAARARYAEALAMGRALGDRVREGVALEALGEVDLAQGRLDDARPNFEAAARLLREAGDRERSRWPVDGLGRLALAVGDTALARELFEASRAEARALGNESGVGAAALLLGQAAHQAGDYVTARGLFEESLALARRLGDPESEARGLLAIGRLAIDAGAVEEAAGPLAQALGIAHEAGLLPSIPPCLDALAAVAEVESAEMAARLLGAASTFREMLGLVDFAADRERRERTLRSVQNSLGPRRFAVAHGAGRAMTWREAVDLALPLGGRRAR